MACLRVPGLRGLRRDGYGWQGSFTAAEGSQFIASELIRRKAGVRILAEIGDDLPHGVPLLVVADGSIAAVRRVKHITSSSAEMALDRALEHRYLGQPLNTGGSGISWVTGNLERTMQTQVPISAKLIDWISATVWNGSHMAILKPGEMRILPQIRNELSDLAYAAGHRLSIVRDGHTLHLSILRQPLTPTVSQPIRRTRSADGTALPATLVTTP